MSEQPSSFSEAPPLTALTVQHEGQAWQLWAAGDNTPHIRDLEWAERLGFARPRNIRGLIKRMAEAGQLGNVFCSAVKQKAGTDGPGRGRPGLEYYLTEEQALLVAAKSETAAAHEILRQVIAVFMKARSGALNSNAAVEKLAAKFSAELEAAREERRGNLEERYVTLKLLNQLADRLAQPAPAPDPQPSRRAPAQPKQSAPKSPAVEYVTGAKLQAHVQMTPAQFAGLLRARPELRLMQRGNDSRWPLSQMAAEIGMYRAQVRGPVQPAPVRALQPQAIQRQELVDHVTAYCAALGESSSGQAYQDIWRLVYQRFEEIAGYNPRTLKQGKQNALDVVEAHGHLALLGKAIFEVCPASKITERAAATRH